jgi:hypothetical protein
VPGPIQSFALGLYTNATIAASAQGTAAATVVTTAFSAYAASTVEVWNLTGQNLDVVLGPDNTTNSYTSTTPGSTPVVQVGNGVLFCPGNTTISITNVRAERAFIPFSNGMKVSVRTCANAPITCSATAPLVISFWE